jgi:hypothetical protein
MERARSTANLLALVAGVFTAFAEVTFFRTGFGVRYFQGLKTALVVPLLFFFPIFWPREDPRGLWLCLMLYTVMCLRHRSAIWRRIARGEGRPGTAGGGGGGVHSLYNGVSKLERVFPRASEAVIKGKYEPLVMLGMGVAALIVSPPLGWFFVWCSVAMGLHAGLIFAHQRQRELDLSDARIDGQLLMGTSHESGPMVLTHADGPVVRIHHRSARP